MARAPPRRQAHSDVSHIAVVRAVLCAGLYPNVMSVGDRGERRTPPLSGPGGAVAALHPSTVNAEVPSFESRWLVYYEKMLTSRVFLRDSTMVTPFPLLRVRVRVKAKANPNPKPKPHPNPNPHQVTPFPLLLFGGELKVRHAEHIVTVDKWIEFSAPPRTAVLFSQLREELNRLLLEKIREPTIELELTGRTIKTIVQLLQDERGTGGMVDRPAAAGAAAT